MNLIFLIKKNASLVLKFVSHLMMALLTQGTYYANDSQ